MSFSAPGVSLAAGTSVQGVPNTPPAQQTNDVGRLGKLAFASAFALTNGTPSICNYIVPVDLQVHRFLVFWHKIISTNETGGQINLTDGAFSTALTPGGSVAGDVAGQSGCITFGGRNLQVVQGTALTGGASSIYVEIWGA